METDWRKRVQIFLIILLAIAAVRVAYVFYDRSQASKPAPPKQPEYSTNWDDYVTPKQVVAYDLKSMKKELAGKTAWVRAGYVEPYYRFDPASHSAELSHRAGLLPPLEQLELKDAVLQKMPVSLAPGQVAVVRKQVLAIFTKAGEHGSYAAPIGTLIGNDYTFTVNDIFYFEDPQQLYKHWPPDVWSAIDHHEVKPGMNELQAGFALGSNVRVSDGDYGNRTVQYNSAGKQVTVTFEKNKAVKIEQGTGE